MGKRHSGSRHETWGLSPSSLLDPAPHLGPLPPECRPLATEAPGPKPSPLPLPHVPGPLPVCLRSWPCVPPWPLTQAASLPTYWPWQPSQGGWWCVLTCEASLSEALSVQISRGLPPPSAELGAGLTGLRLPALSRLPWGRTARTARTARVHPWPPAHNQAGGPAPSRQGSSQGPDLTWTGPRQAGIDWGTQHLGLPSVAGPVLRAVGEGPELSGALAAPIHPACWPACHSGRKNRL